MSQQCGTTVLAIVATLGGFAFTTAEEPKAADAKTKEVTNSIGMKLRLIPAGEFQMGCTERKGDEFRHLNHEQHRVRITKPFYLGTYHVTRGEFRKFVKDTGYTCDGPVAAWDETFMPVIRKAYSWENPGFKQTDEHPVVTISWDDAVAFCNWLSKKEGKTYRLPTEAEWEYACRAGTTTDYYSGDDPKTLAGAANVRGTPGYERRTVPVGTFKPNAFGLYDMHGNAYQWCADWYDSDYYKTSPKDDPICKNPAEWAKAGNYRSIRGGSWASTSREATSYQRGFFSQDTRYAINGFRLARDQ